jgi:RNA-binding protein
LKEKEMLTGKQRSYLRGLGNTIDAIIHVGKDGIDESFLKQINEALEARELIKISVLRNSDMGTREACDAVCSGTGADPVQVIGNRFIVYKKSKEKSKIILPVK